MPNQFKIDIVEQSTARLKEATGIYFAKYTGMNVIQATEFRKACRETSVEYIKEVNELFLEIEKQSLTDHSVFFTKDDN